MNANVKVDYGNNCIIIMSRTFEKAASQVGTPEYSELQAVRESHPNFKLTRRPIKKNSSMEHYKGLTYDYMRSYIAAHESGESLSEKLSMFDELVLVSQCHSTGKRYSTIKSWFLEEYPEVKLFGMSDEEKAKGKAKAKQKSEEEAAENAPSTSNVVELPADNESNELPAAV